MDDLTLEMSYKLGKRNMKRQKTKLIQEWLALQGFGVVVDGGFGSGTDFAVREYQRSKGLEPDGVVGKKTFTSLTRPMRDALASVRTRGGLGKVIVSLARRHLKASPRELGGKNLGPWVRLYMKGYEGPDFPWCAGFVSFVVKQACDALGAPLPVESTFSCDVLARSAKEGDRFQRGQGMDRSTLKPGSIFLRKRVAGDWTHTGIVIKATPDAFMTIEGNTNDMGSREGYEVCRRFQSYKGKDFVTI